MYCSIAMSTGYDPDLFFREKKNAGLFLAEKIFPARTIRIFLTKTGIAGKFTTKQNTVSKLYIRLSDNYPIIG